MNEEVSTFLSFGEALGAVKKGFRIARVGWNGKDMFVYYTQEHIISGNEATSEIMKRYPSRASLHGDPEIKICAHLDMKTANGSFVVGWLASQTDMLAQDWYIVR
jgi:hypothetical protein